MTTVATTVTVTLFHSTPYEYGVTDWHVDVTASGVVEFRGEEPWLDYSTVEYRDEYGREYEPHGTDEDVVALALMNKAERLRGGAA